MRGKQIMTVTGPVNANLLGTVYSHEHLIVQPQIPDEKYIAYTLSDENASAKEVQLFANAGGKTIVEMMFWHIRELRKKQEFMLFVVQGFTRNYLCRHGLKKKNPHRYMMKF